MHLVLGYMWGTLGAEIGAWQFERELENALRTKAWRV
jgi:hypothetical protein